MRWLAMVVALAVAASWLPPLAPARAQEVAAGAGRRVALVVGNSAYANVPALANPGNDARALADALRRLGFATVGLDLDLGRSAMLDALKAFTREARTAEMALVYYAGHGIEVGGRNYLIPTDARLATDDDTDFEAVPLDLVLRAVEGAKRLRVVILDACRDNPFAAQMVVAGGSGRGIGRGLARIEPPGDMLVAYAAKDGQVAADGEGGHSPFAAALLRNLETPGLEVQFLFRKVRDDVLAATGNKQQPHVYGSLGGEPYYLAPPPAAEPPPPAPVAQPAPAPASVDYAKEIELAFWRSAAASQDLRDFEEYLRQFPDGAFAGLARNRMEMLRRPPPDPQAPPPPLPPREQAVAALPPVPPPTSPPVPATPPPASPPPAPVAKPSPDPLKAAVLAVLDAVPCSALDAAVDAGGLVQVSGLALRGDGFEAAVRRLGGTDGVTRVATGGVTSLERSQCAAAAVAAPLWRAARRAGRPPIVRATRQAAREGEAVSVRLEPPEPADHLYLDLYVGDGSVRHLRAGPLESDGRLDWPAKGPARSQLLTAIATTGPLDLGERPQTEDAAAYLAALGPALARAAGRGAAAADADLALMTIRPGKAPAPATAAAPTPPAKEARRSDEPRCRDLLLRLQLGEMLTDEDRSSLQRGCRS